MPIEFPCEQCRQTLRVPDNAAGKLSRCPKCGYVGRAPAGTAENRTSVIPGPGYPTSPDPYADTTARWDGNPYAAPTTPTAHYGHPERLSELTLRMIRDKIAGPATALVVLGIVNLLLLTAIIVPAPNAQGRGIFGFFALMMAIKGGIYLGGGLQMKKLRGYGLALTASILAVIPCCVCWIAELPIGIWALAVLSDRYVKRAFEQQIGDTAYNGDAFGP